MKLNIYNNFKAFYYNTLVNFYLYFNTLVPYYDDVILSLSITSFKNIINNSSISLKTINQNRIMQLLYSLNDKDKIILDDDGFILINYDNNINDIDTDNISEPEVESEVEPKVEPEEESKVEPEVEPEAEPEVEPKTVAKSVIEAEEEIVYDEVPETYNNLNSLDKKNN
jgi:hypothetical protein